MIIMQLGWLQPVWHLLNDGHYGYFWHFLDVAVSSVVCFGLVNQNPVGRFAPLGWLYNVTADKPDLVLDIVSMLFSGELVDICRNYSMN